MVQLRKQGLTHTSKRPPLELQESAFREPRKTERYVAITRIVCLLREGNNSELFQTTYNLTKNPAVQRLLIGSVGRGSGAWGWTGPDFKEKGSSSQAASIPGETSDY